MYHAFKRLAFVYDSADLLTLHLLVYYLVSGYPPQLRSQNIRARLPGQIHQNLVAQHCYRSCICLPISILHYPLIGLASLRRMSVHHYGAVRRAQRNQLAAKSSVDRLCFCSVTVANYLATTCEALSQWTYSWGDWYPVDYPEEPTPSGMNYYVAIPAFFSV